MRSTGRGSVQRGLRAISIVVAATLTVACGGADGEVRITVPTGATMRAAAESLHHAGVIRSPRMFRLYATVRRADRGIKAGTYALKRDASWESLLSALRSGRGVVNVVTIPEGYTLVQTESLLVTKLTLPKDSVRVAVRDTVLLRRLDAPSATLEGYLFPDTYFFSPGTTARVAVQTMVRRFEQQWKPEWGPRLDTLRLSRHGLVTLASIVETEARRPAERATIAAVYWNRLRKGMLLQADPTVQYALPQRQSRLLNRHLLVRSPYNTYRYVGLPPGPIAAPGSASIEAALHPANVPYLYFVAYPDGHHEFRLTLREHELASREARRAWEAVKKTPAATTKPAAGAPRATNSKGG
jgi:UPF0755 protein